MCNIYASITYAPVATNLGLSPKGTTPCLLSYARTKTTHHLKPQVANQFFFSKTWFYSKNPLFPNVFHFILFPIFHDTHMHLYWQISPFYLFSQPQLFIPFTSFFIYIKFPSLSLIFIIFYEESNYINNFLDSSTFNISLSHMSTLHYHLWFLKE